MFVDGDSCLCVGGVKTNFNDAWNKIAEMLNKEFNTSLTATQCKDKFKNDSDDWKVIVCVFLSVFVDCCSACVICVHACVVFMCVIRL